MNFLGHQELARRTHAAMLEENGLGLSALAERGLALFMVEVRVPYSGQIFLGDEVLVKLRGVRSGIRLVFSGEILKDGRVVSLPSYTMALCSIEDGRPMRLPDWIAEKFPSDAGPAEIVTPTIACVDTNSRSVLPTGSLRFRDGALEQEATIIIHRPDAGEPMGLQSSVWLPVPAELVAAIRKS